ncbi:MAG: RNA methyltransferase [Candidatus Melainabacteria bacterium]|nr:RNA methyltransferase [Candidatus Melainabacteria bacterium]
MHRHLSASIAIDSLQNEWAKSAVALHQRKHRLTAAQILVEGIHPVEEALAAGLEPCALAISATANHSPALQALLSATAWPTVYTASERVMVKLSTTDSPAPCVAVFRHPHCANTTLLGLRPSTHPSLLILDGLQDPGNVGTLIRSAVAFGVRAVLLTQQSVDPYSAKVIRATAGLVFRLPVLETAQALGPLLQQLRQGPPDSSPDSSRDNAWQFYATSSHCSAAAQPYHQLTLPKAWGLIIGHEGQGIRLESVLSDPAEEMLDKTPDKSADEAVQWLTIPMEAGVESLNAAMSGSIILASWYEKQRTAQAEPPPEHFKAREATP